MLNLTHNQISGLISTTVTKLSSLYELNLSQNYLSGLIPSDISKLQELQSLLDLSNNNLSSDILESSN
jgi:Leucine-rich repeat (LRR) protein